MGKSPKKYPIINFQIWNEYLRTKNKIHEVWHIKKTRKLFKEWFILLFQYTDYTL